MTFSSLKRNSHLATFVSLVFKRKRTNDEIFKFLRGNEFLEDTFLRSCETPSLAQSCSNLNNTLTKSCLVEKSKFKRNEHAEG